MIIIKIAIHEEARFRFETGCICATPGAVDLLDRSGANASDLIEKHREGKWGILSQQDVEANEDAVRLGGRILSAYELGKSNERLWLITEWDRSMTTLLLPEEY